jgi:hypothetical protein
MPVVIFFARLDLEQKSTFMDGYYLILPSFVFFRENHTETEVRPYYTLNDKTAQPISFS